MKAGSGEVGGDVNIESCVLAALYIGVECWLQDKRAR